MTDPLAGLATARGEARVPLLLEACRRLVLVDPATAEPLVDELLARTADGGGARAEALLLAGRLTFTLGRYDASLGWASEALAVADATGDELRAAEAQNLSGTIALERGEYDQAARLLAAAHEVWASAGHREGVARARANLGLVHWRIGDLARAREDFEAALALFRALGDDRAAGNLLNSLGLVTEDEGDPRGALALYLEALPLLRAAGDPVFVANVLANVSGVYEALGERDEAWTHAEQALELRLRVGHARGVVGSRVSIGRLALARGEVDRAEREVQAGLIGAAELGLRKHEADLVELSSALAARGGDFEAAWRHARRTCMLRQELAGEDLKRRVAELRSRLDVQEARRLAEVRHRENEALRRAHAAAESASRAKSEFVAVMSHEFRTPLTTIIGALDLLAQAPEPTRQAELVGVARASADALLSLVEDVLDLSRIEAGQLTLEATAVDLDALTEQLVGIARVRAQVRGVMFHVERAPGTPSRVVGDGARVRQILLNLLSNAVKFTERGAVALRVAPAEPGVRFEVEDTGVGIPPEVLPRLFQPFVQADSSTTRRFGGTGLGLSIVRRLVDAMGGEIDVRSTPGVGTRFAVTLPLPVAPEPEPTRPRVPDTAPTRVLVVDDDDRVAEVIGALLEHLGCAVVRAASGGEALERTEREAFGLVLLDVHMPGMDGFELARRLRARHGPGLRMLGLTGAATSDDRARGLASGMDGYLTKPISLARLAAAVRGE